MSTKRKTVAVTIRSRFFDEAAVLDYVGGRDANERAAALVHLTTGTVLLPWWPEEIEQGDLALTYFEFERPGLPPLLVPQAKPLDTYNLSFALVNGDYEGNVNATLDALRVMAAGSRPVSLVLAKSSRGLFHVTALSIIERDHTKAGNPKWADVSMTLKRASDYTVKVGPVKTTKKGK